MTQFLKTEPEIKAWLDKYNVNNCELVEDQVYGYVVNVEGNVNLNNKNLDFIPVKFGHVSESFFVANNKLTNLEHGPQFVGGSYLCENNLLTSLKGSPQDIIHDFNCSYNQLKSFEGCPKEIGGVFYASVNQVENLFYLPQKAKEIFLYINDLLGNLQFINDFEKLYEIHKVLLEQKLLHEQLETSSNSDKRNTIKI